MLTVVRDRAVTVLVAAAQNSVDNFLTGIPCVRVLADPIALISGELLE
jgi:hypothetical protein